MSDYVNHNPDILTCLANLSNDEVFTPPELANQVLDLIPEDFWRDPNVKVLDPACKSGVFLRECAKRFLKGLESAIPDLQERIDHIFQKQLYGYAITELTSYMTRRSVYCSKFANGPYSVSHFEREWGNINYKRMEHIWDGKSCSFCGAPKDGYNRGADLENYAYRFIHLTDKKIQELKAMKFDLIISNPPYQLTDGGGKGASATPIYQLFVEQAKKLKPRYMTMIIMARWYSGGKGLDEFRNTMLNDNRIRELYDYFDSEECFPGVDLSGGACYFLWDRDHRGECHVTNVLDGKTDEMVRPLLEANADTFIRFNKAVSIIRKIAAYKEERFSNIVSTRKPFGLNDDDEIVLQKKSDEYLPVYAYPKNGFIHNSCVRTNTKNVSKFKVFVAKAFGERGKFPYSVISKPFLGVPQEICTETYLLVNPSDKEIETINTRKYMATRFFRFLVLCKKNTQNAPKNVYDFVPLQDFSKPWTDDELYVKYKLTEDEIAFIESMVKPMDLGDSNE